MNRKVVKVNSLTELLCSRVKLNTVWARISPYHGPIHIIVGSLVHDMILCTTLNNGSHDLIPAVIIVVFCSGGA